MNRQYTPSERLALVEALASGVEEPSCPVCHGAMLRQGMPTPAEVSYVRDRVLLVCGRCHRAAALDRRAIERSRPDEEGPTSRER